MDINSWYLMINIFSYNGRINRLRYIIILIIYITLIFILSCKSNADKDYDKIVDLAKKNKCSEVIELSSRYIFKYKNDCRFYAMRATFYKNIGKLNKAIADAEKCLSIDNSSFKCYLILGNTYTLQDKYKLANDNFNNAMRYAKDNKSLSKLMHNVSLLHLRLGGFEGALAFLFQANEYHESSPNYYRIGAVYNFLKNHKLAEKNLLKALSLSLSINLMILFLRSIHTMN